MVNNDNISLSDHNLARVADPVGVIPVPDRIILDPKTTFWKKTLHKDSDPTLENNLEYYFIMNKVDGLK